MMPMPTPIPMLPMMTPEADYNFLLENTQPIEHLIFSQALWTKGLFGQSKQPKEFTTW